MPNFWSARHYVYSQNTINPFELVLIFCQRSNRLLKKLNSLKNILKTHDFNFLYFQELVISQNFSGHLVAHSDWPTPLKNKGVFFIKREMKPLPKENFLNELTCGDIHPNALDHFCAWVEEVSLIFPLFKVFFYQFINYVPIYFWGSVL